MKLIVYVLLQLAQKLMFGMSRFDINISLQFITWLGFDKIVVYCVAVKQWNKLQQTFIGEAFS